MIRLIVLVALLLTFAPAHGAQDYRCTVHTLVAPGMSAKVFEMQTNIHVGKQFTVERRTGVMAGVLKNAYVTKPEVIDSGSDQNSFKVVNTLRVGQAGAVGSNVYTLVVSEHETSPHKPFIFLENDVVYTGICEHF